MSRAHRCRPSWNEGRAMAQIWSTQRAARLRRVLPPGGLGGFEGFGHGPELSECGLQVLDDLGLNSETGGSLNTYDSAPTPREARRKSCSARKPKLTEPPGRGPPL